MSDLELPPLHPINIPYTVCEALVGLFAVLGNGIVIIVLCGEKRMRSTSNFYIISLAFADFLLGFVGIPFAILVSVKNIQKT